MGYRRKILEARKIGRSREKYIPKEVHYVVAKRQCLKKMAYPSEKVVLLKISEIANAGRCSLRYYQCPFCELYHISHKATAGQKFVS
jgi:hypothetical protein